jgi:hypothetical protein
MRHRFLASFAFSPFLFVSLATNARASAPAALAGPGPHAYAIVVGSNAGGAGQQALRFAESDAEQIQAVLLEVGHFDADRITVLAHPDSARVMAVIDEVAGKVRADDARGEPSQVVFYYSGHARANAINLGDEELSLATLRERIRALPATLTIVVLDACQSGAFARSKGAERAADFSYNSVSKLTQKGLAVMASSTSQELSQESDELRASYFTHSLVSGLRGAADVDGDGRVSLDEAYRYAYRRTLASTARTQVGEQHVTLETDLAGQGDLPVTYPAEAKAQLELPAALDARVLVQHRASGAVVAEVQKARGTGLRLALVQGSYDAIVGTGSTIVQCRLALADGQVTPLDTSICPTVAADSGAVKGEASERDLREIDRWGLEGSVGLSWHQTDGFTDHLGEFGYQHQESLTKLPSARFTIGVSRRLAPHLETVLELSTLAGDVYQRSIAGTTDTATLRAYGGAVFLRAGADVVGHWLGVYGEIGAGMSLGTLKYETAQTGVPPSTTEISVGYLLSGAAGVKVRFGTRLSLFLQAGYDRAPVIANLIGDTHDSGGPSATTGLRLALGQGDIR